MAVFAVLLVIDDRGGGGAAGTGLVVLHRGLGGRPVEAAGSRAGRACAVTQIIAGAARLIPFECLPGRRPPPVGDTTTCACTGEGAAADDLVRVFE